MVYCQKSALATRTDARRAPVSGHGMGPAPARSRNAWGTRFGHVCSAFKYACCEPCSDDLYDDDDGRGSDGHSDLDDVFDVKEGEHKGIQEAPKPISSFESSQAVARVVGADKHREDRERLAKRRAADEQQRWRTTHDDEEEYVDGEIADSPSTDVTRMGSLTIEDFSVPNEEKTPISDAGKRRSSRGRQRSRDQLKLGLGRTPPRHPTSQSRWSDEVLEGFLYSTLVDGTGLVLDKLDSDGKGKKSGERILSYDPEAMRLNWISTGLRRKPGSMLAKDIDEVLCEGTSVTIVYSQSDSMGGSIRRLSMSPMRRSSHSTQQTARGRRRKIFKTSQERDAHILTELLLFVRRKALMAFSVAVSQLAASANGSSASSAVGFGGDDDDDDDNDNDSSDDGGAVSAVTKSRSFGSGGVRLGSTGGLGRSRRRHLL